MEIYEIKFKLYTLRELYARHILYIVSCSENIREDEIHLEWFIPRQYQRNQSPVKEEEKEKEEKKNDDDQGARTWGNWRARKGERTADCPG